MKRYGTSFLLITAMLLCTSCSGLKTYHLKNGIPVYVKNDTGKKIDAVYIVVKCGVVLLKPEQSGFEEAVFTDMTYASGHFTDTERTQLLNQTRSSISCASGENGSSLRLECIDSYLYKDIPVFTDSFMHPVFNRELFDILMRNCSQRVSFMLNDPQSFLLYSAWKNIYSGHPLETQPGVTPESIGNFSLISLAAFHRTLLDSRCISVIAAGSMNGPWLVRELNKTLGTIASGTGPLRIPEMKDAEVNGPPV